MENFEKCAKGKKKHFISLHCPMLSVVVFRRPAITDSLQFIPYLFTCAGIICAYLGGGSKGSEYILEKGTKCIAPERELSTRACRTTASRQGLARQRQACCPPAVVRLAPKC